MSETSYLHAINCAERAAERAAAIFHRELSRGTTFLQAVVYIAPLLGMFGSAVLVMGVLHSYYNSSCDYGDCAGGGPAEIFVPLMLSLPVAIFACAGLHWLSHQVESLDLEMHTATLDLLNDLARGRSARR